MSWKLLLKSMILFVLLCAGGIVAAVRTGEATPPGWGFTYASKPNDGLWEVYALDIERRLQMPFRIGTVLRSLPLVSPDGRFVVWREVPQSFLLDRERGILHTLDQDEAGTLLPLAWSPGSDHLVYTNQSDRLFLLSIDADGAPHLNRMIDAPEGEAQVFPVWSPDGSQIAFLSFNSLRSQVYITQLDAAEASVQITREQAGYHRSLTWSPSGSQIAYLVQPNAAQTLSMYIVDADGENHRLLRDDIDSGANAPTWSPDGTRIAYPVNQNDGLYVVDVESGLRFGSLDAGLNAGRVRWSPDSRRLVFLSLRDSDFYVVNATGGFIQRLTDNDNFNVFMP